jgi:quercetin dioxygenase-like cupin family protein
MDGTDHVAQSPFIDLDRVPIIEPVPGCRLRTPHGQNLMLSYLEMDAGAEVPLHSHPHEQGGVLLSGILELTIGDETRRVTPGSLFLIPSNVPHRAVAVNGPVTVLDVFSPVREDYASLANRYIPPPGSERAS